MPFACDFWNSLQALAAQIDCRSLDYWNVSLRCLQMDYSQLSEREKHLLRKELLEVRTKLEHVERALAAVPAKDTASDPS